MSALPSANCRDELHKLCKGGACGCDCHQVAEEPRWWTLHAALISWLRAEGYEIQDFRKRLLAVCSERMPQDTVDLIREMPTKVPDAYQIDAENREITVFEVEDTNPLTNEKLRHYINLWFLIDYEDWQFKLITVNRFYERKEIPLPALYLTTLTESVRI